MESYKYLHKRVLVTSKARYEASRRLKLHSWCSQWTLTFLAVGQIILSLLYIFEIYNKKIPDTQINMASLFFAIAVLAYSLLLGMGDFSARSSNIHQCGLQLAELSRELHYKITRGVSSTESEYLNFVSRYYACLNRHENHTSQDYFIAKLDYLSEIDNLPSVYKRVKLKIKILLYRFFGFSHYLLSVFSIITWGSYMTII
ncbi:SLATT domain-containing protein [Aeromonas caviae]|uniref:SLATT domain-containing protein n=1 Tax=Aeromonas caviae TaxID=648 RepID=UPI0038737BA0